MICFCFVRSLPLSFLSLGSNWCSQGTALTPQTSPEPVPSVPHNPCWRGDLCHWCSTWPKKHYIGGILAACCLWNVWNPAPSPLLPCLGPAPKAQSGTRLQSCRKGNVPVLSPEERECIYTHSSVLLQAQNISDLFFNKTKGKNKMSTSFFILLSHAIASKIPYDWWV